jgi:TolB-like protein
MNGYINKAMLIILAAVGIYSADSFAGSSQGEKTSAGDLYRYNYHHRLPADYIYRTGQVVTDQVSKGEKKGEDKGTQEVEADLATLVKDIVAKLFASRGDENLKEHAVAVSTLVNLNNLYRTSSLGRYLSEQLGGELHRAGIEVVDVRKTPGLMISQENGEYSLSRDMDELSYVHPADAVVVGTYTFVDERLFINVRLLNSADGIVLASASAESPVGSIISQFLADESMPVGSTKPIEVRTLVE